MAAKPSKQYHTNMNSKYSFSAVCTAFCVTTATVFWLCCENREHCQTRQSKPTPYFTHSQVSNFDEIQYFSKFHVQGKAVPYVTIIMDNTQLNVQYNHNHKKTSYSCSTGNTLWIKLMDYETFTWHHTFYVPNTHTHTKLEVTYKLWDNNMEKGSICAGVTVSQSNWQKEK